MELVFRICMFFSGVINFLPSILAILPNKISESYGIEIPDQNYELLVRHRAVLFGIIGALMIFSAIKKSNYNFSVLIGVTSMVSFIMLYTVVNGTINSELTKVMYIDAIALFVLVIGFAMFELKKKRLD